MSDPTQEEVIDQIRDGDRHIVDDADSVEMLNNFHIRITHEASDGDVIMRYSEAESYIETSGGFVHEATVLDESERSPSRNPDHDLTKRGWEGWKDE